MMANLRTLTTLQMMNIARAQFLDIFGFDQRIYFARAIRLQDTVSETENKSTTTLVSMRGRELELEKVEADIQFRREFGHCLVGTSMFGNVDSADICSIHT